MALINCPECKKEISDKAESCPHCGFPLIQVQKVKPKALDMKELIKHYAKKHPVFALTGLYIVASYVGLSVQFAVYSVYMCVWCVCVLCVSF